MFEIPAPGQGQIKIKQHACGVNFIDAYFRMGMYPSPVGMPFIAGNESAGEVMAVGPGVTDVKVGDRVAFVGPLGGYAAERAGARRSCGEAARQHHLRTGRRHDAEGHDRPVPGQPDLQGRQGHDLSHPCRRRRRRSDSRASGRTISARPSSARSAPRKRPNSQRRTAVTTRFSIATKILWRR